MKNGITKEQSKMIQGLAIIMMLYHHLFATPEIFGIEYFSLLNIGGINIEQKMAWFFKICVGIFAFMVGYGYAYSKNKDLKYSFLQQLPCLQEGHNSLLHSIQSHCRQKHCPMSSCRFVGIDHPT